MDKIRKPERRHIVKDPIGGVRQDHDLMNLGHNFACDAWEAYIKQMIEECTDDDNLPYKFSCDDNDNIELVDKEIRFRNDVIEATAEAIRNAMLKRLEVE